jgi:hypothetical protein
MPGSMTTSGRPDARVTRLAVLLSIFVTMSAPELDSFAAQWLAYAYPCQRFADTLTDDRA